MVRSEYPMRDALEVVRHGIEKEFAGARPKKVVIVGAGLAELAATYELKRASHNPVILEAQQRVGGRVDTLREPFTEGSYAGVGAMRILRAHALKMEYIEQFCLKTNDFTMDSSNTYYYIGGRKMCAAEAHANLALLGFEVYDREVSVSWMWHDDEFAGGAFALFDPGQQALLYEEIIKPEGRIHFAGEHASLYHAWIQGALESGLRAAIAIHQSP